VNLHNVNHHADNRNIFYPANVVSGDIGFRVASIPEFK
jgi:hypothetical protein